MTLSALAGGIPEQQGYPDQVHRDLAFQTLTDRPAYVLHGSDAET